MINVFILDLEAYNPVDNPAGPPPIIIVSYICDISIYLP